MDRNYLGGLITGQYASLMTTAGLTNQQVGDRITGYGPALDNVMTQLGLAVSADDRNPTITAGLEQDATLLTRYYALDWLIGLFALQTDRKTGVQTVYASQRFKQLQAEIDRIKVQVPSKYSLEPNTFEFGRLELDFLEPVYGPFGTGLYPW